MLTPIYTNKIAKDIKKAKKQGKDLEKFKEVARLLVEQKVLDKKYRDHSLTGNYDLHRECHIEPDWLLIYKLEDEQIIFSRLGSHCELFR